MEGGELTEEQRQRILDNMKPIEPRGVSVVRPEDREITIDNNPAQPLGKPDIYIRIPGDSTMNWSGVINWIKGIVMAAAGLVGVNATDLDKVIPPDATPWVNVFIIVISALQIVQGVMKAKASKETGTTKP